MSRNRPAESAEVVVVRPAVELALSIALLVASIWVLAVQVPPWLRAKPLVRDRLLLLGFFLIPLVGAFAGVVKYWVSAELGSWGLRIRRFGGWAGRVYSEAMIRDWHLKERAGSTRLRIGLNGGYTADFPVDSNGKARPVIEYLRQSQIPDQSGLNEKPRPV